MLFYNDQCNFSTCKDLVCLLSNLVEYVLIAYGPLGSFSSFVILLYILLSCQLQTSRINLQILSQDFMCLGLDFEWEPTCTVNHEVRVANQGWRVKSRGVIVERSVIFTICFMYNTHTWISLPNVQFRQTF